MADLAAACIFCSHFTRMISSENNDSVYIAFVNTEEHMGQSTRDTEHGGCSRHSPEGGRGQRSAQCALGSSSLNPIYMSF